MLRKHAWCRGVLVTYTASGHDLVRVMNFHKKEKRDKQNETERRRNENRDVQKMGETESVIGLSVDGVLETCVKPGALTAGFRERGKGYGLESVYFILWRLISFPLPTPFWTSVASFHSALCGCFSSNLQPGSLLWRGCCRLLAAECSGKPCNQIFCTRNHQH